MSDKIPGQQPYKKTHIPSRLIGAIEIYYLLFILYILGYALLRYTLDIKKGDSMADSDDGMLVYLFCYGTFVFFLILKAAATYSVYEYYVALFILFQKLIVITITILRDGVLVGSLKFATLVAIGVLNYLEFAYLISNLFARRQEISLYLFKLTGVNPSVNRAFAVRRMLEVTGYANTFVSFYFFYSINLHLAPRGIAVRLGFRGGYVGFYLITYLFTFVCIEKEIRRQRIAALVFNVLTLLYLATYMALVLTPAVKEIFHN